MIIVITSIIKYAFYLFSFPEHEIAKQRALSISPEEKSALTYIRKHNASDLCLSTFRKNGNFIFFREELIFFNKKYTITYLDSVERVNTDEKLFTAFNKSYSKCAHEVVFPKKILDNFLLCEVYPHTGRIFTETEAYLFQVKIKKPTSSLKKLYTIISYTLNMDYFNDPELNGKYLGTITKDFATASDTIKEASYQIRKREISQYPVFIFARQAVQLGSLLINADEQDLQWHVFASYLEILAQQGIVDPEKAEDFIGTWKNPDEFCCLFVVDEEFTNFVYIPYPED